MDNLNCGNSKKNILLITPMLHQGGFERVCLTTAKLLQKNYHVTIAVFSLEDVAFDIKDYDVVNLEVGTEPGYLSKLINLMKRAHKLKVLKRERDINISFSFGPTANFANVLSRVNDQIWTGIHGFASLNNKRQMQFVCNRADKVICCSKVMENEMRKRYRAREILALWNPCDVDEIRILADGTGYPYEEFCKTNDKVIVSMGREHDVKGFWHLLKSFSIVHEELPDTRLIIVGDGEYAEYKKLAKDLFIAEKVLFTGLQKNPFPYLKEADVYVLSSISEGLPNALVEALSTELPIVSVNCKSGPAEILCDNWEDALEQTDIIEADYGILTPAFSMQDSKHKNLNADSIEPEEQSLAEGILKMLKEDLLREKYQKKALKRARDFSNEAYEEQLIQYIEED